MNRVELIVRDISNSLTQSTSYAVILEELEGNRRLLVVIGVPEAQSIALAMEGMTPSRPLTHDLMKSMCEHFEIDLKEVVINQLLEGVFHAKLVCELNGSIIEVDSRTSDALALAVRFGCPIFTSEEILQEAGIDAGPAEAGQATQGTEEEAPAGEAPSSSYQRLTMKKLNSLLEDAISKEDYEKAAKLRDEIDRREA
ncbi:bifunctional nuclease family protein [Chitinophagales bacterium]|nr:bifunctional nuclease family protein [Chitinophagales bacterium]